MLHVYIHKMSCNFPWKLLAVCYLCITSWVMLCINLSVIHKGGSIVNAGQGSALLSKNSYSFQNQNYLASIRPPFNLSIKTQLFGKSCLSIILVSQKFRSKFLIYSYFTFKTLWDLIGYFCMFFLLFCPIFIYMYQYLSC